MLRRTQDVTIVERGRCGLFANYTLYIDGALAIRGIGDMTNYTSTSSTPWYSNRSSIKSITIEPGVTFYWQLCILRLQQSGKRLLRQRQNMLRVADLNGDGSITVADVTMLLQKMSEN